MDVTVPVKDDPGMYLREAWATAEDETTGTTYELTRAGSLILLEVTKADGTVRKQSMHLKDLMVRWAMTLDDEAVTL